MAAFVLKPSYRKLMYSSTDCVPSIPGESVIQAMEQRSSKETQIKKEQSSDIVVNVNNIGQYIGQAEPGPALPSEAAGENEVRRYLEVFLAEVLGTALLMAFGCMSAVSGFSFKAVDPFQGAVAFGMVVASIVQIFGHVSAAHLNPCVTVCFYVLGEISLPMVCNYLVAEVLGANLGFALLKALTPGEVLAKNDALCCTVPHVTLNAYQALSIEFLSTGFLVLLVCSCVDPVNGAKQDSMSLKFGTLVALISFVAGPYTGASINPARSLAPAIWNGVWTDHWVYWVGPLGAAILVPLLYQALFLTTDPTQPPRKRSRINFISKIKL